MLAFYRMDDNGRASDLGKMIDWTTSCKHHPKILNPAYRLGVMSMRVAVLIDECVCSSTSKQDIPFSFLWLDATDVILLKLKICKVTIQ